MTVDGHYLDGVYYDGKNGSFVKVRKPEGGEGVAAEIISPPRSDVEPVPLDNDEWESLKEDLLPVPEKAIESPAAYYEHVVETLRRDDHQFDVGFRYADEMTEVAELHAD